MARRATAPGPSGEVTLRDRLVTAATHALEQHGVAGITMRALARDLDVSHTAPLRHFDGFADLLAEVAADGFDELRVRVESAGDSLPAGAGPIARLIAACREYVEFAVERPEMFALMFDRDVVNATNARLTSTSHDAHRSFLRLVRSAQDDGLGASRSTAEANAAVWSLTHGFAVLWTRGPLPQTLGETTAGDAVERALRLLVE